MLLMLRFLRRSIVIGLGTVALVATLLIPLSYANDRWPSLQEITNINLLERYGTLIGTGNGNLCVCHGYCPVCHASWEHTAHCPHQRIHPPFKWTRTESNWRLCGVSWTILVRPEWRNYFFCIPLAYIAVLAAIVPVRSLILFRRRRRRERNGQCIHCGYDLTGNTSGKCPECGTPVPSEIRASNG